MRIIHISDLHLGIKLMDFDLIEDQKFILKQIIKIAKEKKVEAILLSGDIYDVPVPRIEATILFDEFLTEISKNNIKIFMISGNHDQVERLSFGSKILINSNIYISEKYSKKINKIELEDEFGKINFYLLPFIKPINVKTEFTIDESISYDEAIKIAVENIDVNYDERNIILAHQFITGSKICDSESIQVGGTDQVSSRYFENFDYVALGHLHTPQIVNNKPYIRYSGSPIKLSFSEVKTNKICVYIDIKKKNDINIEEIKLKPMRDLAVISGNYNELMEDENKIKKFENAYLKIILTDDLDIPFAKDKMRNKYKNVLMVSREIKKLYNNENEILENEISKKTDLELINDFYKKQLNKNMNELQINYIKKAIEEGKNV